MRRVVKLVVVLVVGTPVAWLLVRSQVMQWGATSEEAAQALPGDGWIPSPGRQSTRAISIAAPPSQVFPWIAQMGAGRAAFYSFDWFETHVVGCPLRNSEAVVPEWQTRVGDVVRMCPEGTGPPMAYVVKELDAPRSWVLAIEENGRAVTTWSFVLVSDGAGSRLLVRNRTGTPHWWQELIEPGVAVMEVGMLRGLAARAERSPIDAPRS